MGIQNLLPTLESCTKSAHISEFRGQIVAVDTYCWLHKAARGCAFELAMGEPTDMYVTYCTKLVQMLLSFDIKPILVFDGRRLPAKLLTEEKRQETKRNAKKEGMELLRLGRRGEACKYFKQCVDVTPEMAFNLIKACREMKVDCIVAPYESDAQLAFFSIKGIADVVISEDSDLLVFGCKKVLYKMDATGNGQLVDASKLYASMKIREQEYTLDKFRYMCILSGCDYLDSLPGIGLKKALKFITMTHETNPEIFLDKVPKYLNMRHLQITKEYKESFLTADATFKHQLVFDPFTKELIPLNPVTTSLTYCTNSGQKFDATDAYQLALGNLNPLTMEKMDDWRPSEHVFVSQINPFSIWAGIFIRHAKKKTPTKPKALKRKQRENETETDAYDQQIEKELLFYKKPRVEEPRAGPSSRRSDDEEEEEEGSSPKLNSFFSSNNPFIKKKLDKISKFDATFVPDGPIVKSKFFTRSELEAVNEVESDASGEKRGSNWHRWYSPQKRSFEHYSSDTSGIVEITSSDLPTADDLSDIGGLSEMEKLSLEQEKCQAFLSDIENQPDDDEALTFPPCECVLEESDREFVPPNNSPPIALISVENLTVSSSQKRKRDDEDKNKPKKQATITEMFKRMSASK